MCGLDNSDVLFTNINHFEFRDPKIFTCNVFWGRLIHFLHSLIFKTLLCHPCFSRLRHFAAHFSTSLHNRQREKGQRFPKNVTCTKFRATKKVKISQQCVKKKEKNESNEYKRTSPAFPFPVEKIRKKTTKHKNHATPHNYVISS